MEELKQSSEDVPQNWLPNYIFHEIGRLHIEIGNLRQEVKQDINDLRQEVKQDINGLRQEINGLRQEINQNNAGLRQEINGLRQEMKEEINGLRREVSGLRLWSIGTVVAVIISAITMILK